MNHEAVWWQRVHCLFTSGVVGEMHFESGRGEIETILFEEGFARRLEGKHGRALHKRPSRQSDERYAG